MIEEMPRWLSIAAGAIVALACVALLFLGVAWLAPRFVKIATHEGAGRTTVIVVLVLCLFLLQGRRWQAARRRRRHASGSPERGRSPLNLTSGM
jgi:membrane protein DedA with SNARE-associated domain